MDQAVWVIFGVIATIIAIGIVGKTVFDSQADVKLEHVKNSVNLLKAQCDYVCGSPQFTKLGIEVELPSGVVLTANNTRICAQLEDTLRCSVCDCIVKPYIMDLSTSLAKKTFFSHTYSCKFERNKNDITMECTG